MSDTKQTISRTSKIISRILALCFVVTVSAAILFVVGIGILKFADSATTHSLQKVFSILTAAGNVNVPSVQNLTVLFLLAIVQLIILFVLFFILYHTFLDISHQYTPFKAQQVIRLKRVAFLTLLFCIVSSVTDTVGHILLYGEMILKVNVMWLVMATVIFCLAYIFDYGTELQKQSDETL